MTLPEKTAKKRGRMTAEERLDFLLRQQKELADEIKRQHRLLAERKERKRQETLIMAGEIVEKAGFLDRLDELRELLARNAEYPAPPQQAGAAKKRRSLSASRGRRRAPCGDEPFLSSPSLLSLRICFRSRPTRHRRGRRDRLSTPACQPVALRHKRFPPRLWRVPPIYSSRDRLRRLLGLAFGLPPIFFRRLIAPDVGFL